MFKDNLRNRRRAANMSQKDLGDKLNVVQGTIASWEKGRNEPSIAMLVQLADIFDCTLDELVGHTEISQDIVESSSLLYEFRQLSAEERHILAKLIETAKGNSK